MPGADRPPHLARFESFELDVRAGELRPLDGAPVRLPEQSLRILVLLLKHPGEVVQREEIQKRLWPNDTIVEFEHSISAAVNRLRQALGDSADKPKYVETLARRGYRWMVPVEWAEGRPAAAAENNTAESSDGRLIGKKVSHYRVLQILGGGGMGVVYEAEDLKLGRRVALKFLPEELASDSAVIQRFESEARSASALNHPNICTIYGVEELEGQPFLVMELLEGQTLRDLIVAMAPAKSALGLTNLLDLAVQITAGLAAAHRQGIIHRDIKPANIFVTSHGQAKILDFGLAKLSATGPPATDDPARGISFERQHEAESPTASSPFLSRTGVAMGTAAYMSPEQVRGEKLDGRTDLFSFGLVLYEMATGHQAFYGDTAAELHEAILNGTPVAARQLNPELPPKLGDIIQRALEKDREVRYQSALELRAHLETLRRVTQPKRRADLRVMLGGVAAALLIASAIFWLGRVGPHPVQSPPELKLRQLTNNSFENPVLAGAISPDSKYLAYSDAKGIRIQLLATGETRVIPQPEELNGKEVDWEVAGTWFPDSTRFVANAHLPGHGPPFGTSEGSSIWMCSVLGGPAHKLRENAEAYSVSPDGTLISFGTNKGNLGDREIWLMGPEGEQPRKLYDSSDDATISLVNWSGDGQRVIYGKTDPSGETLVSRDQKGGPPTELLRQHLIDFLWLPDGRLIYSVPEPGSTFDFVSDCNFWEMRLDALTGQPTAKPRRITNWSGFCMSYPSVTSNSKKLVFLRSAGHMTSYMADLVADGTRILQPKHFPLSESSDAVADWFPDSKSVILISNRAGHLGIYKQLIDKDTAEPLVTQGFDRDAHVSPDGKSVIYFGTGENGPWPVKGPEPVMRASIAGGPSQQLFTASSGSQLTCARPPSDLCAIGEETEDLKQLVVSLFDSMKGRGPELFRFALGSNNGNWRLNLSPDGTRFAVLPSMTGPIYIFSLRGKMLQQVRLKDWSHLQTAIWAADGQSLFVTAKTRDGGVVLHVDLQGNAHVLWENPGTSWETMEHPSPDGRYLEFDRWTRTSNMWLMENF